jgi:hypothetical protein
LNKGEGIIFRYKLFIATIKERLDQLEDLAYAIDDVNAFKNVMGQEAKLVLEQCPTFHRKPCVLSFLTKSMEMKIISINDEWNYRLVARFLSQAVSRNNILRLPWEVLLFGKDKHLEGHPETIDVPDDLLGSSRNVRSACQRILQAYQWATFDEMAKVVLAQSDSLNELDRFWCLTSHFLQYHARPLGETIVKQKLLDALPDSINAHKFSLEHSMRLVAEIKSSELTIACGQATEDDVDLVFRMLSSLQQSQSPTAQTVQKMLSWSRQMLNRCEHFLTVVVPLHLDDPNSQVKGLSGRAAMQHLWDKFERKPPAERQLEEAAPFRQFAWMLTCQQNQVVDSLIHSGIAAYQAEFLKAPICDGPKPHQPGTATTGGSSASSSGGGPSSSSSASTLAKSFIASAASDPKSKSDPLAASKSKLLAMFRK